MLVVVPVEQVARSIVEAGEVDLAVYDAAGKRGATLVKAHTKSRRHSVTWNGGTDRGGGAAGFCGFVGLNGGVSVISVTRVR